MSSEGDGVRSLRFSLARALGQAADESGSPRIAEALAELERALAEAGDDPPDAQIQLAAAGLLESTDPAGALARYIAALSGHEGDEAVARALKLLERVEDPVGVIASLSPGAVESVHQLARRSPSPEDSILASLLMRGHGEDEKALALLERTHERAKPGSSELTAQLAEAMLDLDRADEALELVVAEDPQRRHPSLQLVRAQAHLALGDAKAALEGAARRLEVGSESPEAEAVRALSLLALEDPDRARELLPQTDAPEIQLARAVVELHAREYTRAREASWALLRARPTDPDALLINAQTVVEAVGTPPEDPSTPNELLPTAAPPPGAEIEAARNLLSDVVAEVPARGRFSRWWRSQLAIRREDGRFAFFWAELRSAQRVRLEFDELDAIDASQTTWVQDGALEELKAEVLQRDGDHHRAAAAYDEASRIFREIAVDVPRAAACARAAHDQMPSPERAHQFADSALNASYEESMDLEARLEFLDAGRAAADRALKEADDETLAGLVHVGAWVRGRRGELEPVGMPERKSVLLPWLFAGVALGPDDAVLRALLAWQLNEIGRSGAAMVCARTAYEVAPDSPYVAEIAVVTATNYESNLDAVRPLLEHHATLSDDVVWRRSLELFLSSVGGDREGAERLIEQDAAPMAWAQRARATAKALRDGLGAARLDLEHALKETLEEDPPSTPDAVFFDALLRRPRDADAHLAASKKLPETTEVDLDHLRLIRRFAFDETMGAAEFLESALPLCASPGDVGMLVNVDLPLLVAARAPKPGRVPPVRVDEKLVDARLDELALELSRWFDSLHSDGAGLVPLARLVDPLAGPSSLAAAALEAEKDCPDELLRSILGRVGGLVVSRSATDLPRRLLEVVLGRRNQVDHADVQLVLDQGVETPRPAALLVALLAVPDDTRPVANLNSTDEDEQNATSHLMAVARELGLDPEQWWRLDDALAARADSADPTVARLAAAAEAQVLDVLGELVGLSSTWWPEQRRRPLVVALGPDLLPEQPDQSWVFFTDLLPGMRERIFSETGFEPPACSVMPEWEHRDGLRLLANDAPLQVIRLPTTGYVHPVKRAADGLVDPLTGDPVAVDHGPNPPPGSWTPLGFAIRHIERFVRDHLTEFVSVTDAAANSSQLAPEVAARVTSDPTILLTCQKLLREAVGRGEAHDRDALAVQIVEAVETAGASVEDRDRYVAGT
jgi:tetratricopeptide (TPR) repeat protein